MDVIEMFNFFLYCFQNGLYIKYVREGERVFVEAMKYFKLILMDHEIFLKIFDASQKIFLCLPSLIIFSDFIQKAKEVWAQNIQTGHQGDLTKTRHVKMQIKSTQVYIWKMIVKFQKHNFYIFLSWCWGLRH